MTADREVRVTYDPLAELLDRGRPDNPKGHDLEAIEESIETVGYVEPIIVNDSDDQILSGHGRVAALHARQERGDGPPEGVTVSEDGDWLIPVLHGVELSEEDAERYVLAANQTTIVGGWDEPSLAASLGRLAESETGLVGTGFEIDDLAALREALREPAPEKVDPDDIPETPTEPYVQRGDIYSLGDHRILCGDATVSEEVFRLLGGERITAMVTDPPYGIDHQGVGDDSPDAVRSLYANMLAAIHLADAVVATFQSPRMFTGWLDVARAAGLRLERMLWLHRVAAKTRPWRGWVMASDAILLMSVGKPEWPTPTDWCHDTYERIGIDDPSLTGKHTTIKPVAVFADLIAKLPQGGPVLDPFLGTGTTLVAADGIGRACYGMDIEPRYVQVTIERWQAVTGRKARRLSPRRR